MTDTAERVRNLYRVIENGLLPDDDAWPRVAIVRELERLTGTEFGDTADFRAKVEAFILRGGQPGAQLVEARKAKRWSQRALALSLGISQQFVAAMEKGRKPLTDKALAFIRAQET